MQLCSHMLAAAGNREVLTKPIMAFLDVTIVSCHNHHIARSIIVSVELEMFYLDMHDCDYWYLQAERWFYMAAILKPRDGCYDIIGGGGSYTKNRKLRL